MILLFIHSLKHLLIPFLFTIILGSAFSAIYLVITFDTEKKRDIRYSLRSRLIHRRKKPDAIGKLVEKKKMNPFFLNIHHSIKRMLILSKNTSNMSGFYSLCLILFVSSFLFMLLNYHNIIIAVICAIACSLLPILYLTSSSRKYSKKIDKAVSNLISACHEASARDNTQRQMLTSALKYVDDPALNEIIRQSVRIDGIKPYEYIQNSGNELNLKKLEEFGIFLEMQHEQGIDLNLAMKMHYNTNNTNLEISEGKNDMKKFGFDNFKYIILAFVFDLVVYQFYDPVGKTFFTSPLGQLLLFVVVILLFINICGLVIESLR